MQRLNDQPILFDPRHVESALDRAPKTLAAALALLAASGAEGDLWAVLKSRGEWPEQAMAEIAALYIYAADRVAAEFFALLDAEPATRDFFFQETATEAGRLLREQCAEGAGIALVQILEQRRSEYGRCRSMYRSREYSLEGTVMFAFYKHLLAFGCETAVGVMSRLQLDQVENEVGNAFAEAVGRVSLTEGAEVAESN
jgi:hypothetical protein